MKIRAVLFDMDGVIISTRQEIEAFWHYWAGKANIVLTESDVENYIHGCPPQRTLSALFPHINEEFRMEMEKDSLRIGRDARTLVMPGLLEFMEYLENKDVPFGIVTSHAIRTAKKIVEELGLEKKIKTLITADQLRNGKPFPDPYLLASERLDISPQDILVFEDSISGCTSALKAGMNVIGVNTPQFASSLWSLGVLEIIEDFTSVREKLKTMVIDV